MGYTPQPIYIDDPRNLKERDKSGIEMAKFFKIKRKEMLNLLNIPCSFSNYKNFVRRFRAEIRTESAQIGGLTDCNHSLFYSPDGDEENYREVALVTERINGKCQLVFNFLEAD